MKKYKIYLEDKKVGNVLADEIKIEKDSYLYGGEEKFICDLFMFCNGEIIFSTTNRNEIYFLGDSIFIYE